MDVDVGMKVFELEEVTEAPPNVIVPTASHCGGGGSHVAPTGQLSLCDWRVSMITTVSTEPSALEHCQDCVSEFNRCLEC